jgi:VanZ family protein
VKQRLQSVVESRVVRVCIAVVVSLLILGLSLTPKPLPLLRNISFSDKIQHTAAYLALAFCVCAAFRRRGYAPVVLAVILCAAFGGAIEIVQPYFGRTKDLVDFLADLAGALAGAMLCGTITRRRPTQPTT